MIEPRLPGAAEFAAAAERIGVDSLWVPEVWGYDALTGLAYIAAKTSTIKLGTFVVQLGSRSPALLATSALSLQELSDGRFLLGVGTSGPRVMEGWHGVRFRKPVQTTQGDHRDRPNRQPRRPSRASRRDLSASAAGQQRRCAATNGATHGTCRSTWRRWVRGICGSPARWPTAGSATRSFPKPPTCFSVRCAKAPRALAAHLADLDLVAPVAVEIHDDEASADAAARRHADGYAFTIGAMGAGGRNFYNDAFTRLGYGEEVGIVAELWQSGKRDEARQAVPIDLGRLTNLVGTPDGIAERVRKYRAAGITTLLAKLEGDYAAPAGDARAAARHHRRRIDDRYRSPRSSGTSTACSLSASNGTRSRVRSCVEASTTGAAHPSW